MRLISKPSKNYYLLYSFDWLEKVYKNSSKQQILSSNVLFSQSLELNVTCFNELLKLLFFQTVFDNKAILWESHVTLNFSSVVQFLGKIIAMHYLCTFLTRQIIISGQVLGGGGMQFFMFEA